MSKILENGPPLLIARPPSSPVTPYRGLRRYPGRACERTAQCERTAEAEENGWRRAPNR
jgi:hypothetical protein